MKKSGLEAELESVRDVAHPHTGSCDTGHCDNVATWCRYYPEVKQWLSVCQDHALAPQASFAISCDGCGSADVVEEQVYPDHTSRWCANCGGDEATTLSDDLKDLIVAIERIGFDRGLESVLAQATEMRVKHAF